jgi:NTE family protein
MRALVLSGGGARGGFQVGALQYLTLNGARYDAYCGTSVGAINAAHMAMYPAGHEADGVEELVRLWTTLGTDQVYRKWYHGLLWLLPAIWKPSVYSTQPLRDMLWTKLDVSRVKASGKKLLVGAVSLDTLDRCVWDETAPTLREAVEASAAMPAFFEPVRLDNQLWIDGGIREGTPLQDAIKLGATRIDVIVVDQEGPETPFPSNPKLTDVAGRTIEIMLNEITLWDIKCAELYNKLVDAGQSSKRKIDIRVLRPSKSLGDARDFSPAHNKMTMEQGFRDASKMEW